MKRAIADKIASVAQSCGLTPELRLSADIPAEEGVVVAVEVLNDRELQSLLDTAARQLWDLSRKAKAF